MFFAFQKLLAFDQEIGEKMEVLDEIDRDTLQLKSEMRLAVYDLERSFQEKHETLFKKRMEVINGLNEPNKIAIKFWSSVLEYLPKLDCMVITRYDKAVLFHLIDIRVSALLPPNYGQKFEFHFEPNQFLKSTFLTKTYLKKLDDFHNFEIYESFGCEIKWKKGMNIIGMNDKLNPETPFFKADTFFNFFAPPKAQKPSDQLVDVSIKQIDDSFNFLNPSRNTCLTTTKLVD